MEFCLQGYLNVKISVGGLRLKNVIYFQRLDIGFYLALRYTGHMSNWQCLTLGGLDFDTFESLAPEADCGWDPPAWVSTSGRFRVCLQVRALFQ